MSMCGGKIWCWFGSICRWTAGGRRVTSFTVGAHTGPGLGVSTNKAPLTYLPGSTLAQRARQQKSVHTSVSRARDQTLNHTTYKATHSPHTIPLSGSYTIPVLMPMTHKHISTTLVCLCHLGHLGLFHFYEYFIPYFIVNVGLGWRERKALC